MRALVLAAAMLAPLASGAQTNPLPPPAKPELQVDRPPQKAPGKRAAPPEEDTSFLKEEHSFNPLQSQNSVVVGDSYRKKGNYRAAAARYLDATMWNDGNAEAWIKLGKADEKLKDWKAAKAAYLKYVSVAPSAKDSAKIRKKLETIK